MKIIDMLQEKEDYSMAFVERALELPQRTMMRWKKGQLSDAAIALLRIIGTYPWIMDVADAKYDSIYAQKRLTIEGAKAMFHLAESANINQTIVASANPQSGTLAGFFAITPGTRSKQNNLTLTASSL
jgi:hypothetical protein